ncbi:MAG TPA: hypothetical protein VNY08_20565 [Bradyrhizobium sp.]|nr:hypothetical protein [Bradyrhizobium sp.]
MKPMPRGTSLVSYVQRAISGGLGNDLNQIVWATGQIIGAPLRSEFSATWSFPDVGWVKGRYSRVFKACLAARTCAKTTIFASEIKPIWAVQPFAQKISLNPSGKSVILVGASHANEGRLAIVTNVAVRCGGRDVRD